MRNNNNDNNDNNDNEKEKNAFAKISDARVKCIKEVLGSVAPHR